MMMMARRTMRRMVGATAWPWARATRSLSLSAINDNRIIMSPPLVTLDLPEIWTPPDSHDCNPLPQRNCCKHLSFLIHLILMHAATPGLALSIMELFVW